ncbi:MAG: hypothetical protein KJ566_01960 [Nanoarchaeota archaeon]|nr:hypothetical protein [Nanoarchaeota archaeon]
MKEIIDLLKEQVPKVNSPASGFAIEQVKEKLRQHVAGGQSEGVPLEIMICPYMNTSVIYIDEAENLICNFFYNTKKIPTKLDCYLCKK